MRSGTKSKTWWGADLCRYQWRISEHLDGASGGRIDIWRQVVCSSLLCSIDGPFFLDYKVREKKRGGTFMYLCIRKILKKKAFFFLSFFWVSLSSSSSSSSSISISFPLECHSSIE